MTEKRYELAEGLEETMNATARLVGASGAVAFEVTYDAHPIFGDDIPPGWPVTWRARAFSSETDYIEGTHTDITSGRAAQLACVDLLRQLGG